MVMLPQKSEKGFTLIELLVVIAVIGLLSSVILASLNNARQRGRDTRRIEDLRQIANQVAITDSGGKAVTFAGCTSANSRVSTCTTPDLSAYKDPSGQTSACSTGSTAACDYVIGRYTGSSGGIGTANPDSQNWIVCAYLESGIGPRSDAGMIFVDANGSVRAGCN